MSELQRGLAKRPGPPRPLRPSNTIAEEDAGESSESSASSISSVGTIVAPSSGAAPHAPPTVWYDYFQQELYLVEESSNYHVYLTSPDDINKDPLFICHHGAGSGGLSFALLAKELRARMPRAGVMAIEARDHGSMVPGPADGRVDFALPALSDDFIRMIDKTRSKLGWAQFPSMVFVGHSLGGAVVTEVARRGTFGAKLIGFAVIDVVEGSAVDAIKHMQTILDQRPTSFRSVDQAIDWHVRSRTIRNPASAKVSAPSLLLEDGDGDFVWRTNLQATAPYWQQWFTGMSAAFLSGRAAKLLLLAGTDRLDKELMIGQMQGKFQMQVFPEAGHFVQEDSPEKTADVLVEFYKRNDRSTLVLPPKVSDLLAQGKKV